MSKQKQTRFKQLVGNFLRNPWASGVVLLFFVGVAMLLANLPATKHIYHQILSTELSIGIGKLWNFSINIEKFINDGLMVVFFFVVGLEIKHEIKEGQLSTPRKAILPVV
ncbi:MAG: Na+/H+ antiporter NhaA, partial [Rikenellaceae bacterium]|nr:Na+/H+ antiporter NhaA [Rikenellaceae bacterium]